MNTRIAILLELSTTTTTMKEVYLEFLFPWFVMYNINWRAFLSIATTLSFLLSIYLVHTQCPSRRHDDLLEEGFCRCTDTKWGWVVKLRLIGVWDQVVDWDTFTPVVWSSENEKRERWSDGWCCNSWSYESIHWCRSSVFNCIRPFRLSQGLLVSWIIEVRIAMGVEELTVSPIHDVLVNGGVVFLDLIHIFHTHFLSSSMTSIPVQ